LFVVWLVLLAHGHVIELFSVTCEQYFIYILFSLPLNSAIKSYLAVSPNGKEHYIPLLTNSANITASPMFPFSFEIIKK
jgi:hypothetical protein